MPLSYATHSGGGGAVVVKREHPGHSHSEPTAAAIAADYRAPLHHGHSYAHSAMSEHPHQYHHSAYAHNSPQPAQYALHPIDGPASFVDPMPMPDPELDFGDVDWAIAEHGQELGSGEFHPTADMSQFDETMEPASVYHPSLPLHSQPPSHQSHPMHHPDQPQPPKVAVYDDSLDSFENASSSTPSPSAAVSHSQPQVYHSSPHAHPPPHYQAHSNYPPPVCAAAVSNQRKRRSRSEGYSADASVPGVATIHGARPTAANPLASPTHAGFSSAAAPLSIHRSQSQYSPVATTAIAVAVESPQYGSVNSSSSGSYFHPPPSPSSVLSIPFSGLRVVHEQEHDSDSMHEERAVMARPVTQPSRPSPSLQPVQSPSHGRAGPAFHSSYHATQPLPIAARPPPPHYEQVANARMRSVRTSSAPTSAIIADPHYESYSNPQSPAAHYHPQMHSHHPPPLPLPHGYSVSAAPSPARRRVIVKARSSSTSGTAPRLQSPHTQSTPSTPRHFFHPPTHHTPSSGYAVAAYSDVPPLQLSAHAPLPFVHARRPHSNSVISPRGYAVKHEYSLNVDIGDYPLHHSQPNTAGVPSQSPVGQSHSATSSPNGSMRSPKYCTFNFSAGQVSNPPAQPHHAHARYTPTVRHNTASAPPFIDDLSYVTPMPGNDGYVPVKQEAAVHYVKREPSPTPSTSTSSSLSHSQSVSPPTTYHYHSHVQPHSHAQAQWAIATTGPPSPHNGSGQHFPTQAYVTHPGTALVHSVPHHASVIGSPVSTMSFLSSPTPSSHSQSPPISPRHSHALVLSPPPTMAVSVATATPTHPHYHAQIIMDDSELVDESFDRAPAPLVPGTSVAIAVAQKKSRAKRRKSTDLPEAERWYCPLHCSKYFRRTSSRSIAEHMKTCPRLAQFRGNPSALMDNPALWQVAQAQAQADKASTGSKEEHDAEEFELEDDDEQIELSEDSERAPKTMSITAQTSAMASNLSAVTAVPVRPPASPPIPIPPLPSPSSTAAASPSTVVKRKHF